MLKMLKQMLPKFLLILTFLVLWESITFLLVEIFQVSFARSNIPYLHKIGIAFYEYRVLLTQQGFTTFLHAGLGLIAGMIVGMIVAMLLSFSRSLSRLRIAYLGVIFLIPMVIMLPIVYEIVADKAWARVVLSGYVTFFFVNLSFLRGIWNVQRPQLDLMKSYAASRWDIGRKLRFPSALPKLFVGLKIASPVSLTTTILLEMMIATDGIGYMMQSHLIEEFPDMYLFLSTVVTAAILGVLIFAIVCVVERIIVPWKKLQVINQGMFSRK
jgi:NitT/TauT family transport system permease protein